MYHHGSSPLIFQMSYSTALCSFSKPDELNSLTFPCLWLCQYPLSFPYPLKDKLFFKVDASHVDYFTI
jgi:hypothetical protein